MATPTAIEIEDERCANLVEGQRFVALGDCQHALVERQARHKGQDSHAGVHACGRPLNGRQESAGKPDTKSGQQERDPA
jgi:hypothetical protein